MNFLTFFLVAAFAAVSIQAEGCPGCPVSVPTDSDELYGVAEWLSTRFNAGAAYDKLKIFSASVQVVNGLNYYLTFQVTVNGSLAQIEAVVHQPPFSDAEKSIVRYSAIDIDARVKSGAPSDVTVNSPDVQKAASEGWKALSEIDPKTFDLKAISSMQVIKALRQVVAGINYFITLQGECDGDMLQVSMIVFQDLSHPPTYNLVQYEVGRTAATPESAQIILN